MTHRETDPQGNWLSSFASETMRISTFSVICRTRQSNLFLREFIFSCPRINLFIFPLRIGFRLLPLRCLPLNSDLFLSVSWVLLILSLLARLCKTDCQIIMLEISTANWLDKTWVTLLFKWSFDAFRYLTVIAFRWFMKWRFFSRHLSFKYLFTSAAFHRYLSFLTVIVDIDTSQFFFILNAKLMKLSAIFWGSCFMVTSFVPTWSITWPGVSLSVGCMSSRRRT